VALDYASSARPIKNEFEICQKCGGSGLIPDKAKLGHYQENPQLSDMLKLSDILDTVRTSAALAPLHKAVPFPQAILGTPRLQLRHK
jgi:hypothetical protein